MSNGHGRRYCLNLSFHFYVYVYMYIYAYNFGSRDLILVLKKNYFLKLWLFSAVNSREHQQREHNREQRARAQQIFFIKIKKQYFISSYIYHIWYIRYVYFDNISSRYRYIDIASFDDISSWWYFLWVNILFINILLFP